MTARSRSGSIGGLVTWANAWRRWSATGRVTRPRPASGVSSPMLHSGSWPSMRHRPHVEAQLLGVQPVQVAQGGGASRRRPGAAWAGSAPRRRRHGRGGRDDRDPDLLVGEHVARRVVQRQPAEDPRLRVGVREHAPGRRVHEQQLAGREAAGAHDLARCQRDGAGLGRDGDHAVDGHGPGRRPQPVAIQQRADPAAVAEHERAGSVPRRDEAGDPAPERRDGRMGRAAQAGRLGHQGEQCGLERPAGRDQQLERLVERARVRDTRGEQRTGGAEPVGGLPAAGGDACVVAPSADGLAVAADGVDLAVVGDERERLGERPHRLRVGRIALVEQRERDVDRLGQVGEQLGQAGAGHQALVDGGARRRRDDRERVEAGGSGRPRRRDGARTPGRARTRARSSRRAGAPAPGGCPGARRRPRGRGRRGRPGPGATRGAGRPSAASAAATIERGSAEPAVRRRGQGANTVRTPGRSPASPSGSRRRRSDGVRGRRTPAPSLEAPSAAKAPR